MRNSEKLRQRLCLRLEIFFEFYLEDRSATCMVAGRLPLVYHDPLDSYRKAELQNGQAGPDALRSIGCVKQYHDTIKLTKRSSPLSRKKWPKRGSSLCQNNGEETFAGYGKLNKIKILFSLGETFSASLNIWPLF